MTEPNTPPTAAPQPQQAPKRDSDKVKAALSGNSAPLKIYAHSAIVYWWPIWLLGLLFWLLTITAFSGDSEAAMATKRVMGVTFVFTLLFVIFSTTVRLRGANSVIFGLFLVIGFILLATANLTGPIGDFIRGLDVRLSPTAYLVIGLGVLVQWTLMIFGFDRVKYWEIVPGQMHEKVFWGSGDKSENGAGAKSRYRSDDFLRHRILGLMMIGDLEIKLDDGEVWVLHNVLNARARNKRINELIVMRPID